MARQENLNLFALLGDEAEDSDDVSTLIESVVKVDPRVAAEEKRRKKKKNMEAEKPIGINLDVDSNNYKNNNNIVVDMRAKPIVLPEHGDCFFLILFFLFVSGFFFCVVFFFGFLCEKSKGSNRQRKERKIGVIFVLNMNMLNIVYGFVSLYFVIVHLI